MYLPHRKGITLVLLLLALLAASLHTAPRTPRTHATSTTSTATPPISFFGMNTYFTGLERFWNDGDDGIQRLIAMGRTAGVQWGREEISWANLQYARGKWNRDNRMLYDQHLLEMHNAGYQTIGMLLTTPDWARVSDCTERTNAYAAYGITTHEYWCPPQYVQDYADFVQGIVERYDGDGVDDAPGSPRIAVWQIWNEPNHWETWPGTPAEYGLLLEAGYRAAKAADPTALVATGGLYVFDGSSTTDETGCSCHQDGLAFFDRVLEASPAAWNAFDALAIHPYMPYEAPDQPRLVAKVTLWGRIDTARAWLESNTARRGNAERPLWISEVGWTTCSNTASSATASSAATEPTPTPKVVQHDHTSALARYRPASSDPGARLNADVLCKSEDEQASYLVRAHAIAAALGVEHLNFHQLEDKFDAHERDIWQGSAIVHTRLNNYAPKQAYTAYQVMTGELAEASYETTGPLHTYTYHASQNQNPAALYDLRFRTPGNMLIDVLWHSSDTQEVQMPVDPAARSVELVQRDGLRAKLTPHNGSVSFMVSERPLYLRQELPPPTPTPTPTPTPSPTLTPSPSPTPTPVPGDVFEPDNACEQAQPIGTDDRVQVHTFHIPGDNDYVRFTPASTRTSTYLVEALVWPGSGADVTLERRDTCGDSHVEPLDPAGAEVRLRHTSSSTNPVLLSLANRSGAPYGTGSSYWLAVHTLPTTPTGALIVGATSGAGDSQADIDAAAATMRSLFADVGHASTQMTTTTSARALENALTNWAAARVAPGGLLTLYLVGQGSSESFTLDATSGEVVTSTLLNEWLGKLEAQRPDIEIALLLDFADAASFTAPTGRVDIGRIAITSSAEGETPWRTPGARGSLFAQQIAAALRQGASYLTAYEQARWALEAARPWQATVRIASDSARMAAQQRALLAASSPAAPPLPALRAITVSASDAPPTSTGSTVYSGTADILVVLESATALDTVLAEVFLPGYAPPAASGALRHDAALPLLVLEPASAQQAGAGTYRTTYGFTQTGTYRLVLYAGDTSGGAARPLAQEVEVLARPATLDPTQHATYLPLLLR